MIQPTGSFGPMSSGSTTRPHIVRATAWATPQAHPRTGDSGPDAAGMGDHVPGGTGRCRPGCRSNEQAHAGADEYTGYVRPKAARSWATGLAPLISALRMAPAGNCVRRAVRSRNWRLAIQFKVGTWKNESNPVQFGSRRGVGGQWVARSRAEIRQNGNVGDYPPSGSLDGKGICRAHNANFPTP